MMVFLISNFIFANCQLSTKEYCKEYCNVECSDSVKRKKECMIKETRQSYLFILTVLPPLQQLCSPISRSYFKELHNYTILPVTIFIQLLQHTALTCLSHFEDGLPGRMVIVLQDFHRIFLQSNLDFKKLTEAYIR